MQNCLARKMGVYHDDVRWVLTDKLGDVNQQSKMDGLAPTTSHLWIESGCKSLMNHFDIATKTVDNITGGSTFRQKTCRKLILASYNNNKNMQELRTAPASATDPVTKKAPRPGSENLDAPGVSAHKTGWTSCWAPNGELEIDANQVEKSFPHE